MPGTRRTPASSSSRKKSVSALLYTRPLNRERDLLDDDEEALEAWEGQTRSRTRSKTRKSHRGHAVNVKGLSFETTFYTSIRIRHSPTLGRTRTRTRTRTPSKAESASQTHTYNIGDTLLVQPTGQTKVPSVGVLVAIWEVPDFTKTAETTTASDSDSDDDEAERRESRMRIRVHWFDRPEELPRVRAKRVFKQNEIFYSLSSDSSTSILFPSAVVGPCRVLGGTESSVDGLNDSPQSDLSTSTFTCTHATDSLRGLFYAFDWETHRRDALTQALARTESEAPAEDNDDDGEGAWDVVVDDDEEREESTPKGNPTKGKRGIVTYGKKGKKNDDRPSARKRARRDFAEKAADVDGEMEVDEDDDGQQSEEDQTASKRTVRRVIPKAKAKPRPKPKREDEDDASAASGSELESDDDDASVASESEDASESSDPDDSDDSSNESLFGLRTPSRKRKRVGGTRVQPTPHSKAALARRRGRDRSSRSGASGSPRKPGERSPTKSPSKRRVLPFSLGREGEGSKGEVQILRTLPRDPWLRAMHALHVGAPVGVLDGSDGAGTGTGDGALPCRETEYASIAASVVELLEEGSGGCVYISGVPGTGKTATVHAVIRALKRMAGDNEISPFTYCEINGLRLPEPQAAYTLLWEAVSGVGAGNEEEGGGGSPMKKISAKESLRCLMRHFSSAGGGGRGREGRGHTCVILIDELDALLTPSQDVVYNFFNWPTLSRGASRLIVLAVANTMDLPERMMSARVRSRIGMHRINFQPYTTPQLEEIVNARLRVATESMSLRDDENGDEAGDEATQVVIRPDAVKFVGMKVGSISGDARRALDVCRRTLELVRPTKKAAVTRDVQFVIKSMQNSPTAAFLRACSLHERIFLISLVKIVRREGTEEVKFGDVQEQHRTYTPLLTPSSQSHSVRAHIPTATEFLSIIDSLTASRAVILEDGPAAMRKGLEERRVVLNLEVGEVVAALCGDEGEMDAGKEKEKWRNIVGIEAE